MTRIFKSIALLIATGTASVAYAEDFTGERLELRAGGDAVRLADTRFKSAMKERGGDFGVAAGWDFRLRKGIVVGADFAADFDTGKKCESPGLTTGDKLCLNLIRSLSAAARIGAKVTDTILVFGKAGYASGRVHTVYTRSTSRLLDSTGNNEGWIAGGGVEWAALRKTYLKVEYDFSHYGTGTYRNAVRTAVGVRF